MINLQIIESTPKSNNLSRYHQKLLIMLNLFSDIESDVKEKEVTEISGLVFVKNYISDKEHDELIHVIDTNSWSNELKRRVQHYGYKYNYKSRSISISMKVQDLPNWAKQIGSNFVKDGYFNSHPDQLIVNEYMPGQGITSHIDCEPCFEDTVISISLGSYTTMNFTNKYTKEKIPFILPPKSAIILKGESRYEWLHGIPARKSDIIDGFKQNRKRRISLTYRRVILDESK